MTYERLRASDFRFIAVCVTLLAATTWFSVRNFYRAFPEASIDFRVNRHDGQAVAARFLASRGYRTDGFREASSFRYDDDAKTFLEREVGLEQANRIMGSRVRLWMWSYRWFRPLEKEEYRVDVSPRGELTGFSHQLPEDAARPGISAADARARAEAFLRGQMHRDPASLEFVETSDTTRPHRTDRVFTWKERDFNLHDASYRLEVTLLGDEVAGYREYLKIPEQWTRDYQRLRSKNEVAQVVDSVVMVALFVGLIVVIVLRVRKQDVRWRRAAAIGVVGMVLTFLAQLNGFSLAEFRYPTTDSYSSFLAGQLLQALVAALGAGGLLFVLAAGAEPLYREAFPGKISLGQMFRPRGLRTRRFFLGAVLGITLTAVFVAYQTAFYIVAYRYGAWSPADVPYDDLLNTRFPWLFVLVGGYFPAVSEEFLFRMFGIPFLRKLTRSLAAAVILAGFIWGFGHAGYPQQPFFIRGLEVGIGGVVLGLVMLRWGILPTLVWHYSVDAMYSSMLLLRSHNLYYRLSGAAAAGIIVLPVVLALAAYWRRGGFAPEAGLLNGDEAQGAEPEPAAPPAAPVTESFGYRPLSGALRWTALAVFAVGLAALLVPVTRFGDKPRYELTDDQARAAADRFVRLQGVNPDSYRHVTFPETHWGGEDSLAAKYFLERRPVSFASRMFEEYRPVNFWVTRYFKSLDQEEVSVGIHPATGKVIGFNHVVPENRPGADIPPEAARAAAAAFASSLGLDVSAMELKENSSEVKKARRDYALEWEAKPGDPRNLDETRFRVHVAVAGDRVTALRGFWKIPEAYERSRSRQNFISIVVLTLRIGVIAALVVLGILLLIRSIRQGEVRWGTVIRLAIPATLLMGLGPLLSAKVLLQNYNTSMPLETFQAITYLGIGMMVIFGFVLMAGSAGLVLSNFPHTLASFRSGHRRAFGIDALICLLGAAGVALLLQVLRGLLQDRFHAEALFSAGSPNLIVSAAPAVAALAGAVQSTLLFSGLVATLAVILRRLSKPWMQVALGLLLAFGVLPMSIRAPGEFALYYGIAIIGVAAAAGFCRYFARDNYVAYALVLAAMALRGAAAELLGVPWLRVQGWIVVFALLAAVVWAVLPALGRPVPKTSS
jgi:membrane protease YdiL (CAAX protease family)